MWRINRQPRARMDEIANNPPVANAEIEAEIDRLKDTIGERAREASI